MDSTTLKELLKYDGAEFPKKEIKLPLQSVWEYLGYLEISLDCFKLAIQHLDADFYDYFSNRLLLQRKNRRFHK